MYNHYNIFDRPLPMFDEGGTKSSDDKKSKYKVGQVVDINGKKFRVTGYNESTGKWQKQELSNDDPSFLKGPQGDYTKDYELLKQTLNDPEVKKELWEQYKKNPIKIAPGAAKKGVTPPTISNADDLVRYYLNTEHQIMALNANYSQEELQNKDYDRDPDISRQALNNIGLEKLPEGEYAVFQNVFKNLARVVANPDSKSLSKLKQFDWTAKGSLDPNSEQFDTENLSGNVSVEDGWLGNNTNRQINLLAKAPEKVVPTEPQPINNAPPVPTQPMGRQGEIPTVGPFPQDQIQLLGALGDYASIRKYMPWEPVVDLENVDPTFYDPSRELANLNEQIAIGTQGAMTFANPQAYNAGFSQIQGKAAAGAADIMGRYNNLNVGVANQFALTNNQINNSEAQGNAQRQLSLYDKNTVANQQFDNAKRDAKWRTLNSMNNMITNTAMANTLNYMNPYEFFLDPSTGGTIKLNQDNLPELDKNYKSEMQMREEAWKKIETNPSIKDKQGFFETMYGPSPTNPQLMRRGNRANQVDVEGLLRLMQSGFNYPGGLQQ